MKFIQKHVVVVVVLKSFKDFIEFAFWSILISQNQFSKNDREQIEKLEYPLYSDVFVYFS